MLGVEVCLPTTSDFCLQASSGTGKTVLSALALLLRLDLNLHGHIQAFSLVPNRELAAQLTKLLLKLRQSQYITVTSTAVDATWDWCVSSCLADELSHAVQCM